MQRSFLRKSKDFFLLIPLILLIFQQCTKDDKFSHPIVNTGDITGLSPEGAVFHGRITQQGELAITDHGFVWDVSQRFDVKKAKYKTSLGPLHKNIFAVGVHSGFIKGTSYTMVAYARTEAGTFFGSGVQFTSQGGKQHEINQFSPPSAHFGDTLEILGSYFIHNPSENEVKFNNQNALVIYADNGLLKVKVPSILSAAISYISVSINGYTTQFTEQFSIDPPVIHSISATAGAASTHVYLEGKGFHKDNTYNKLFLGSDEVPIYSNTNNYIVFTPPFEFPNKEYVLTLKTLDQQADTTLTFTKIDPWTKKNNSPFHNRTDLISFTIGNRLFAGNTDLWEYIPDVNQWAQKSNTPNLGSSPHSISGENRGYVMTANLVLYEYNPATDQWSNKGTFPGPSNSGQKGFVIANALYYGVSGGHFWKFDLTAQTWTQLADLPWDPPNKVTASFTYHNNGYVIGQRQGHGLFNIMKYSPETDDWLLVANLSSYSNNSYSDQYVVWPLENSVIILIQKASTQIILEFFPETNQLINYGSVPIKGRFGFFNFSKGNKGYFGSGNNTSEHINDFWEYDRTLQP